MAVHIRTARIMRLKMATAQKGGILPSQISQYQKGGQFGETGKSTIPTHKPTYHIKRSSKIKCSKNVRDGLDKSLKDKSKRHSIQPMAAIPR